MKKKSHYGESYYILSREWKTATNDTRHYEKNMWTQSATNHSYKNWAVTNIRPYDDYETYKYAREHSPSRNTIAFVADGNINALKKYDADFLKRVAENSSHQWVAAAHGHIAILQLFCDLGADLRAGEFNALRGATIHNQPGVIQWLHGKGLLSPKHRTQCLDLAADYGHGEIIKWLCAHGASIHDISKSVHLHPNTRALIADMKRESINNIVAAAIAESAAPPSLSQRLTTGMKKFLHDHGVGPSSANNAPPKLGL